MDRHDGLNVRPSRRMRCALVKRWLVVILILPSVLLSGPSASLLMAQEPAVAAAEPEPDTRTLLEKLETRGNLTLTEDKISDAILTISDAWGVNIVVQSDIRGEVNGVFKNAPLKEILDSLLLINGYSYRPVGESLVIMSLNEVGQISPLFTTAIVPLNHGVPEEILPAIEILKSPRGKVQTIKSSRSLMVVDFPHHVDMIRKHALELDRAAGRQSGTLTSATGEVSGGGSRVEVGHYKLQYIRAPSLEKTIADLLSDDGKSSVIEKENQIVVADYPENLRLVAETIRKVDVPRQQVRIAAIIYDISLEDIEEIGINWNSALKGNNLDGNSNPQDVFSIDSITQVPPPLGAANGILTFMSLSQNFDITAVVNALQQSDDSRLLADPNVTVLDNDLARIEIVTEIPYQALTQTSGGGNIGTTSFREAGVKLEVTPRIADDGTIEMDVTPSFSRLTGFTPGDNQPIIDRRETSTTIRVADHQTIVIGGLRQRTDIGDFTGIPILKDIPIAGKLFRNRETTVRESELVVFITPIIVPFDECPQGRYGAALETADCWLHRVPWAEGCPPFGHDGGPGVCDECEGDAQTYQPYEDIQGVDPNVQPQRLPEVEQPILPPADYSAKASRRRPETQTVTVAQARRLPAATKPRPRAQVTPTRKETANPTRMAQPQPPRPVLAQVRDSARPPVKAPAEAISPRAVDVREPPKPKAQPHPQAEPVPRIKLVHDPVVLPHHAPQASGLVPRRLPPVVALTQYQQAAVSRPSPLAKSSPSVAGAKTEAAKIGPSRVSPSRVSPSRVSPSRVSPSRVSPSRVSPSLPDPAPTKRVVPSTQRNDTIRNRAVVPTRAATSPAAVSSKLVTTKPAATNLVTKPSPARNPMAVQNPTQSMRARPVTLPTASRTDSEISEQVRASSRIASANATRSKLTQPTSTPAKAARGDGVTSKRLYQPDPLRKPFTQRYQNKKRPAFDQLSVLDGELPKRLPAIARNPSVSPEEFARQRAAAEKKQSSMFDVFRP